MNDNVRKIFDMLGVEPNEKFKVEGFEVMYYIDEYLNLFDDNGEKCLISLQYLLNGSYKIIKLPKESKKLRDITEEEFAKWVVKNCHIGNCNTCNNCLFKLVYCAINTERCWVRNKKIYSDEFLNQEIEVE